MNPHSPYEILGVPRGASIGEVRSAFRRAVRVAHPDAGGSAARFAEVRQAYEMLLDPARREAYEARPDTDFRNSRAAGTEPASRVRPTRRVVAWQLGLAAVAVALFWGLVQPIVGRSIRPEAATPDRLEGAAYMLDAAVLAYVVFLIVAVFGLYVRGLVALTALWLVGLVAWPFAYWDVATGAERWTYVSWIVMWVIYQAAVVLLLEERSIARTARRTAR